MNQYGELGALWDEPDGPLYRLRRGKLSRADVEQVVETLSQVRPDPRSSVLPRELVSASWYIAPFLNWQEERLADAGGDVALLRELQTRCENELERILGVP